jgi:hypothetical protein
MVLSRKLVTAIVTNVLADGVALAVTKFGLHLSPAEAAEVSAYVGIAAGAVAGFLFKEVPDL